MLLKSDVDPADLVPHCPAVFFFFFFFFKYSNFHGGGKGRCEGDERHSNLELCLLSW
jgi:hypothetical protein